MEKLIKFATAALSFILIASLLGFLSSLIRFWRLPRSLPVSGATDNDILFSRTRAYILCWLSYHRSRAVAYTKLSPNQKPFISPSPSLSPDIVIPPSHVKWLLNQPKSILAQRTALWEITAIKYMFPSADPHSEFVPNLVKRHLTTSQVDTVHHGDIYSETKHWADLLLGCDENTWNEVSLFDAVGSIQKRVGYRVYYGQALGRNEELVYILEKMSIWAGLGGLVIGQFSPFVLRRLIGWLFRVPIAYYSSRFRRIWQPVIRERVRKVEDARLEGDTTGGLGSHSAMDSAARELAGNRWNTVESIGTNFLIMYGVASGVKVPGTLAVILDLMALPRLSPGFLPLLREEIDSVLSSPESWTDPQSFSPEKIPLTTAFMRESMRYSPLASSLPLREVVAKDGVVLPDGTHVPRGTWLVCPTEYMMRDEGFFKNPDVFDPFRFLDEVDEKNRRYTLKEGNDLTAISESFLFYGFGKHSCPGRFLMARLMVVLLTYIVKYYDFEPEEAFDKESLLPIRAGSVNLPPMKTKVRFRRRKPQGFSQAH